MACGLFGKMPLARDFITIGAERAVLLRWEAWMAEGLVASRSALGEAWREAYFGAPIWRFRLGATLCGRAVLGAFMPSVDALGRCFPLVLWYWPDDETLAPPPPHLEGNGPWMEAAEALLLALLDGEMTLDEVRTRVEGFERPALAPVVTKDENGCAPVVLETADGGGRDVVGPLMDRLARDLLGAGDSEASCWWTVGGDTVRPAALRCMGFPAPAFFHGLLAPGQ